jgi:hypothetical protein
MDYLTSSCAVWTWQERAVIAEVKYASKGALKTPRENCVSDV